MNTIKRGLIFLQVCILVGFIGGVVEYTCGLFVKTIGLPRYTLVISYLVAMWIGWLGGDLLYKPLLKLNGMEE